MLEMLQNEFAGLQVFACNIFQLQIVLFSH